MLTEPPHVAEPRNGLSLKRRRRILFDVCDIDGGQDVVQVAGVEADGVQRKAEVEARQVLQFDRQGALVSVGQFRETVIGQHIGPLGVGRQVRQGDGRHSLQTGGARRFEPGLAGEDFILLADDDRRDEAESLDRGLEAADLLSRMAAGVRRLNVRSLTGRRATFSPGRSGPCEV